SFLELVAFDDLGIGHLALAVRAPALLLDPRLTLGVKLVERNRAAGFGGREHPDGDVHQADLEKAFPGRSNCHDCVSYRLRTNITSTFYFTNAWRGPPPPPRRRSLRPLAALTRGDYRFVDYTSSRSSWVPRSSPLPAKWMSCAAILSRSRRRAAP